MSYELTEIDRKQLPLLRNLYADNASTNYISYVTVDTYIRWFEQDPDVKQIKFFCLNGDLSRGTFVVTDRCSAYADTLSENDKELLQLLLLIDYTKGFLFMCLSDRTVSIVRTALKQKNVEIAIDVWTWLYRIAKEKALEFETQPPKEIGLKPVTKFSDYEKAYNLWPARKLSSVKLLEKVAKYNPSIGAFLDDDKLVSWCFRFPTGLLLTLQTDEEYYGKGYGILVAKTISKQVASLGHDVCAGIFDLNVASKSLFGKLGFKPAPEKVNWLSTVKTWTDQDE